MRIEDLGRDVQEAISSLSENDVGAALMPLIQAAISENPTPIALIDELEDLAHVIHVEADYITGSIVGAIRKTRGS